MSGWSQRRVAIIAPRRAPVDRMVAHIASQMCMKDTGPLAAAPTPRAAVPAGAQGGKVQADAPALLHGEGAFLKGIENARQRILYRAHDEAVEQGDPVRGSGSGLDTAPGEKFEVWQQGAKAFRPVRRRCRIFHRRQSGGDPRPGIFDRTVEDRGVRAIAVFFLPDLSGNRLAQKLSHRWTCAPGNGPGRHPAIPAAFHGAPRGSAGRGTSRGIS